MTKSRRMSVTLSEDAINALDEKAFEWQCSRSEAMRQLLENALSFQVRTRPNPRTNKPTDIGDYNQSALIGQVEDQVQQLQYADEDVFIGERRKSKK